MEYTTKELQGFAQLATTLFGMPVAAHAEPIANKIRLVTEKGVEVGYVLAAPGGYGISLHYKPGQEEVAQPEPFPQPPFYTPQVNPQVSPYETPQIHTSGFAQEVSRDTEDSPLKDESEAFERELATIQGVDKPAIVGGETPDVIPPMTPSDNPAPMSGEPQLGPGPRRIG